MGLVDGVVMKLTLFPVNTMCIDFVARGKVTSDSVVINIHPQYVCCCSKERNMQGLGASSCAVTVRVLAKTSTTIVFVGLAAFNGRDRNHKNSNNNKVVLSFDYLFNKSLKMGGGDQRSLMVLTCV